MAFNKEKFIADAKAAGYGDDEIAAELANSSSSSEGTGWDTGKDNNSAWNTGHPPMGAAVPMDSGTSASPGFGKKVDEVVKKREEKKTQEEQAAPLIPEFAQNPLMLAGAGAAGGAAVLGWKTLRDKMNNSAPAAGVERREPTMFGAQRLDEPAWSASTPPTSPLTQEEMMNRLRGLADETSAVNEPAFGATAAPAATSAAAPATAPAAAPSRNLTLEEAQARMAGVTPPAAPAAPVAPPAAPEAAPVAPAAPNAAYQEAVDALAAHEAKIAANETKIKQLTEAKQQAEEWIRANNERTSSGAPVAPENAPNNPVAPTEEEVAAAKAAEEKKAKMPLFSDADKKAFTSEQRSVLQHMQYGQTPEEAKNLLRHFENTLPEGVKLSYGTYPEDVYNEAGKKIKTAGTSKGGFPEPKQNLLDFWNEALGTKHTLNEKGNFDYKPTPEDVTKAHSYWSEKMANATTSAARSAAEKGYASLGALARLAGISLGALGAMHAYKTGKETGDWSDLGLLGGSLLAGASVPAQIAYQGLTYSKPLGETQEQLKQLGKQLEYAGKVGYGRGLVNPPNAIPPPRHTMTNR